MMIKTVLLALVGIMLAGCASIAANGDGVDVSGQINYEYRKSL
jgi:uncharacterized protein YceK